MEIVAAVPDKFYCIEKTEEDKSGLTLYMIAFYCCIHFNVKNIIQKNVRCIVLIKQCIVLIKQ